MKINVNLAQLFKMPRCYGESVEDHHLWYAILFPAQVIMLDADENRLETAKKFGAT